MPGRFCWHLTRARLRRDRKNGRQRSRIKGGAAKRLVKRARRLGEGSTPGASLEGELSRGAVAVWEERGAPGARSRPGSPEDAPGGRAVSLPERGCCRELEHGACLPASLPFFIRLLLLLQRSGSRCSSPPRASAGLSAGLSSQVALGKLVRMPRRTVPTLGPRGVNLGHDAGG